METHSPHTPEASIPSYDSIGDVDQARLYVNEVLLDKVSVNHAETWWNTPVAQFGDLTPYAMWNNDPDTVIRWAHACVKSLK